MFAQRGSLMNKPYSNKALPAGTVLREWRLEEVLGVGGFGIVYKGRGIYFDELVAIKEYFPSSISERDEDDTVVPIDSDAEEVHALGLKKFVEEAKLLWNLSTPTRHPNIVSVRSLFEIHGTAYMVMDFEDGVALSKMLKEGVKFNERSLWNIIRPVAEGLDRAHRVGVLHRDIKPPNILITDDGRPVLIDFGSARFEAAEATSTKVTFHTPPYAALEQYVKTYPQGPWTDIYALGVVLYECVTGKKPPEVLERMHAGLGESLSAGKWPGYTKKFLAAIDAAMTIRPQERPQSISDWIETFGAPARNSKRSVAVAEEDADATRVFTHELANEEIVPVAPVTGLGESEPVETQVPADLSAVSFKGAGQETGARKKAADVASAALLTKTRSKTGPHKKTTEEHLIRRPNLVSGATTKPKEAKKPSPVLIGGIAAALVAVVGGWALLSRDGQSPDALPATEQTTAAGSASASSLSMIAAATKALADDATKAGAPLETVTGLSQASEQLAQQYQSLQAMSADPAQDATVRQRDSEMRQLATRATAEFTAGLLRDVETKAKRLSTAIPWADPSRNAAGSQPQDRQQVAGDLRTALDKVRFAANAVSKASSPGQAIDYARMALSQSQNFTAASLIAYNKAETAMAAAPIRPEVVKPTTVAPAAVATTRTATRQAATVAAEVASSATTLSPSKIGQIDSIVGDGRSMAKQVIRMGKGSSDSQLKANAKLAKTYDDNLATIKASARGIGSDQEADKLIAQAKQTRAYVQFLLNQSNR
jgi:non-specific serine/threonine protein kinase